MSITMLTNMVFQASGSNSGKQAVSSQQDVQSTFSFSSELRKQLSSLNKEANKAAKNDNAAAASNNSGDNETGKAKTEDKDESIDTAAALSPQVLASAASQAIVAVAPEELLAGQPQASAVQAVNIVQDVPAAPAQAVQIAADTALGTQPVSTEPRQSVTSDYLPQQDNTEAVQTAAQAGPSLTQGGAPQNKADAQTANQSFAQAASNPAATTADKRATEKGDRDTAPQITQQLSSFSEKLHSLGLSLKTEAAAAGTIPSAPQSSPSEQVATGVLNAYSDGKMEFTMKLKPEALGELTVKLIMNDGKLTMNIVTGNQQTAKLIESQIPELRASLKDNNIQMESCTVENQSFNNLASSGNFFMSGSDRGNQPYETRRIVLARPIVQELTADEATLAGGIAGARYVHQAMLNCYV